MWWLVPLQNEDEKLKINIFFVFLLKANNNDDDYYDRSNQQEKKKKSWVGRHETKNKKLGNRNETNIKSNNDDIKLLLK